MAMPPHRFQVGQSVEFASSRTAGDAPPGAFTVLRQLPNDQMDREYRVRNSRDGHERVARESQLREGAGAAAAFDRLTSRAATSPAPKR